MLREERGDIAGTKIVQTPKVDFVRRDIVRGQLGGFANRRTILSDFRISEDTLVISLRIRSVRGVSMTRDFVQPRTD